MPAELSFGAIKPNDAIAAFVARGLLRPSFRWQEVWQAEHARAFAVAGVMRLDILRLIRDEVDGAVTNGTGLEEFTKSLKRKLVGKGWWGNIEITDPKTGEIRKTRFNDQRLALIFDVNMRQSHAAGRWARAQRSRMPYMVYRTMRDERVRATHAPWDNVVLPKEHPWWDTHYPPNGWRCRCLAFPIDEAGLQQLKATPRSGVKTTAPDTQWVEFMNRSTGQVERVPRGVDPGFAYNPGKVHVQQGTDRLVRELSTVRPTTARFNDALQITKAVIARQRTEKAFRDFLASPPPTPNTGMPVVAVPGLRGEPVVASVRASDLVRQASSEAFPQLLPTKAAGWSIAQQIVDKGQRLELPNGNLLWWLVRGNGEARRVNVLELQRGALTWWVQQVSALSVDEALARYPQLAGLV